MRVGAVVLNYRTAQQTISCCRALLACRQCDCVVAVDNCSGEQDDLLLADESKQSGFVYLRSEENRGYSAGNNIGIRFLLDRGFDYILITNPDVTIRSESLDSLLGGLAGDSGAWFAGPKIVGPDGTVDRGAQTTAMPTFSATLAMSYPFYKMPFLNYANRFHVPDREENLQRRVYTVMGCCVLFRSAYFRTYGMLDEDLFLYNEEVTWASKPYLRDRELPGLYVPSAVALHDHVKVASKTSPYTVIQRMRSRVIYLVKVLDCSRFERRITVAYFALAFNYLARRNPAYEEYRQQFERVRQECLSFEKNEAGRRDARMEIAKERQS